MHRHQGRRQAVRALFVSDIHLGCRHAHPQEFLRFLRGYAPESLYIVGDFIDWWKLRRSHAWEQAFNDILSHLHQLAENGTEIFYTPGNHDAFLRSYLWNFSFVRISDEFIHITADGRRFLVTHGDKFDRVECAAGWVSMLASIGYDALLSTNRLVSRVRRQSRSGEYSFSAGIKRRVKQVVRYISDFEGRLADYARQRGCSGVLCGHIHTPALTEIQGIVYANTGDWVENCSAFVEYGDGVLELLRNLNTDRPIEPQDTAFPRSEFAPSDPDLLVMNPPEQQERPAAPVVVG